MALAAVVMMPLGVRHLASGDTRHGWWLVALGVLTGLVAVWLAAGSRELRRTAESEPPERAEAPRAARPTPARGPAGDAGDRRTPTSAARRTTRSRR